MERNEKKRIFLSFCGNICYLQITIDFSKKVYGYYFYRKKIYLNYQNRKNLFLFLYITSQFFAEALQINLAHSLFQNMYKLSQKSDFDFNTEPIFRIKLSRDRRIDMSLTSRMFFVR